MWTPLMRTYYRIATSEGLTYPVGRAAYMVSRHINGGLARYGLSQQFGKMPPSTLRRYRLRAMERIQESTAQRWENHFNDGGSLKALKYSRGEWAAVRSLKDLEYRSWRAQWGKKVSV